MLPASNAMAAGAPRVIYPVITPRPPYEGTPSSRPVWSYVVPAPVQSMITRYGLV